MQKFSTRPKKICKQFSISFQFGKNRFFIQDQRAIEWWFWVIKLQEMTRRYDKWKLWWNEFLPTLHRGLWRHSVKIEHKVRGRLSNLVVKNCQICYLTDFTGESNCKMSDIGLYHFPIGFGHFVASLSSKKRHFSRKICCDLVDNFFQDWVQRPLQEPSIQPQKCKPYYWGKNCTKKPKICIFWSEEKLSHNAV